MAGFDLLEHVALTYITKMCEKLIIILSYIWKFYD